MRRPILTRSVAALAVAVAGLTVAAPALAQKDTELVQPVRVFAPDLKSSVCGSFEGTVVWSSGASYDCSTKYYTPPPRG